MLGSDSQTARLALQLLSFQHPRLLAIGVLVGTFLHGTLRASKEGVFNDWIINPRELNIVEVISLCVLVLVVPATFIKRKLDPQTERKLSSIKTIVEDGELSRAQAKMLYLQLAREVLSTKEVQFSEKFMGEEGKVR